MTMKWVHLMLLSLSCAITGLTLAILHLDEYLGLAISLGGMYFSLQSVKEIRR